MRAYSLLGVLIPAILLLAITQLAGTSRQPAPTQPAPTQSAPAAMPSSPQPASSPYTLPGVYMRSHTHDGASLPYVIYIPPEFFQSAATSPRTPLPLILFLHGSGESGTDGLKPLAQGLLRAVAFERARWPAIIIAPQKSSKSVRWIDLDTHLLALIDDAQRELATDPARVYLTGLSQGGYGAWEIGARHAKRFAAVVPVCGWADDPAAVAQKLVDAKTPIWAFHGDADDVVPAAKTRAILDAHAAARAKLPTPGPAAKANIYPGVNHNSWDRAYGEPDLAAWLFQQKR